MINWEDLTQLIPPAIILTVIIFLVKFFGKAVSDQRPFADDRDWQRELDGINFFSRYILSPVVLVFILKSKHFNIFLLNRYDLLLIFLSLIVFLSSMYVLRKSNDFILNKNIENDLIRIGMRKSASNFISFGIILILLYFYNKEMYFYLLSGSIYFLIYLSIVAILASLKPENIFIADVYLNTGETLKDYRLMKINEDNIRLVKDKKVIILNKNAIIKIEKVINGEGGEHGSDKLKHIYPQ